MSDDCEHIHVERRSDIHGWFLHCKDCNRDYDCPTPNINRDALNERAQS